MRIRTVKPDFFLSEDLFDLEAECGLPVRLAFVGLWSAADREGRFKWRPRTLKAAILPHDDIDFSRVLHALTTRDFLVHYASQQGTERVELGWIPTFTKHQVINNREAASALPSVEDCEIISGASTREPRVPDASPTREVHALVEGKGREGKEGNSARVREPSEPLSREDVAIAYGEVTGKTDLPRLGTDWSGRKADAGDLMRRWADRNGGADPLREQLVGIRDADPEFMAKQPVHVWAERVGAVAPIPGQKRKPTVAEREAGERIVDH